MNKDKTQAWVDIIVDAEKKLFKELDKGERAGQECDCEDRQVYKYIHEGSFDEVMGVSFDEVMGVCINCGGYVENE